MFSMRAIKLFRADMAATALFCALPGAHARQVTDLAGRVVTVPDHPKRVLLGEGRFVFAMALLTARIPSPAWSDGKAS